MGNIIYSPDSYMVESRLAPIRLSVGVEELAQEGAELGSVQMTHKQYIRPTYRAG